MNHKKIMFKFAGGMLTAMLLAGIALPFFARADYQSRWVAGGRNANTLAYSDDGINWIGLGNSVFDWRVYAAAWNGEMWVAGGGSDNNSLAYSYDGINWTAIEGVFPLDDHVLDIAWNGEMWVAGGGWYKYAYSYDGINWNVVEDNPVRQIFAVAWNGEMWVATGDGNEHTIAYSYDGINWTGAGNILELGQAVAWNGEMWVAGGGYTTTLAYSYNGIDWVGIESVLNPFGEVSDIAWNGEMWVATGDGNEHTIAYSYDGINWTGAGNILELGQAVAWNGEMWVAVGGINNTIAYSYNGIDWIGLGNDILFNIGHLVASAPAPNLYPPVLAMYVPGDPPVITGLEDDNVPTVSKTWEWSSDEGTLFRHLIDQNPTAVLTGDYTEVNTATLSGVTGTWYLHVQAKDAGNDESEVVSVFAVLIEPEDDAQNDLPSSPSPSGGIGGQYSLQQAVSQNLPWSKHYAPEKTPAEIKRQIDAIRRQLVVLIGELITKLQQQLAASGR